MIGFKHLLFILGLLALCGSALADIVYQGKRVQAWPSEAIPKFDNSRGSKIMFASPKEVSHYSAPKGKIYGLTLLVDFSDQPAPVTKEEISDWLNKEGFNRDGCQGSVRDYYLDVSNGQLDFTNEVYGWYRAKYPKSYYETYTKPNNYYAGSEILVQEIFEYFDAQVDYSRYDNDHDGFTEAINIVYAGEAQEWGQGLWPHAGWSNEVRDGVHLQAHQMTDMPGKFSIYVFIHENGHMVFGWPDLYWYGDYCTMGNRAHDWNPVAINDFYRADQGWIPFVDVTAEDVGKMSTEPGEKCYRLKNPNRPTEEGLVWSYVKNTGRNAALKGSGILMQHYDFSIAANSVASELSLRIVHADSKGNATDQEKDQWPNPGSRAGAFFSGTYNAFSDALYPAIRWYNGNETGLNFTDVNVSGNTLSFCLGGDCTDYNAEPFVETEIALTATLPISKNYAYVTVDLQGAKIAEALGIAQSEIATKAAFYAVEPNGSLNSNTTGEGTGHWFDSKGAVTAWNPDGTSIVFSNVDLNSMTTKIGHMPDKVNAGDKFTVKQALVYKNKQVTFTISITIPENSSTTSSSSTEATSSSSTAATSSSSTAATSSSSTAIEDLSSSSEIEENYSSSSDTENSSSSNVEENSSSSKVEDNTAIFTQNVELDFSKATVQYFDMNGNVLRAAPKHSGCYLMRVMKNGKAIRQTVVRVK